MHVALRAGLAAFLLSGMIEAGETMGTVDRADPRFDALVPKGAEIEKLAEGYSWSEGPVWVKDGGFLLFSDVPNNVVHRYDPGKGVSVFAKPSGYTGEKQRGGEPGSNGLTLDANGKLVLCQHGDRRVARREADGSFTALADKFEGKRFNSPNDLCYHSNGDLYFTDPPYGLEGNVKDPKKELPFQGVFLLRKSGELKLLTKELSFPNGIALSPDEKTLYVAISDGKRPVIVSFDVKEDGTIGEEKVFFDTMPWQKKGLKGAPDGMKIDVHGNLFATGPGGVFVISPKGEYLGRIDPGCATANCGFGDDGSTLYLTADKSLAKIKTTTKGRGF